MALKADGKMSDISVDWRSEITAIAGPVRPGDTKDSWLGRAHAAVHAINKNISFRMLRDLFQGYATDPKYSVGVSVLSAAERARIKEAQKDAEYLADLYRRNASALSKIDPDFHRSDINALVTAARILSGGNSSGTV